MPCSEVHLGNEVHVHAGNEVHVHAGNEVHVHVGNDVHVHVHVGGDFLPFKRNNKHEIVAQPLPLPSLIYHMVQVYPHGSSVS